MKKSTYKMKLQIFFL